MHHMLPRDIIIRETYHSVKMLITLRSRYLEAGAER